MPNPRTADQREQHIAKYLKRLHKGQLAEFQLTRMNSVANFRRQLMQLMEEFIEARAEILAAGMLMDAAPARPEKQFSAKTARTVRIETRGRPADSRRRMPVWLRQMR